jgi:hypothetical protein
MPKVPNPLLMLRCHRYPQPVEISDDHWCGEYRVRPEPPEEKIDVPGNPRDQVVHDGSPVES